MTLVRWNPVRDLAAMEVERLERMLGGVFGEREGFGVTQSWMPAVDVFEDGNGEVVLTAELPGVRRDDIKVSMEGQSLMLEAERHLDPAVQRDRYHRIERGYGTFRRTFTLPPTVDPTRIAAEYADGLLTVRLPRREESKPRQIEVK
jgi:HSP20 family protein